MGKSTNQHFVPQFYLRRFSCDGQIFVFDKFNQRSYKTNIRNIASEKGFYDFKFAETELAGGVSNSIVEEELNKLENEFAMSLEYLLNQVEKKRRRRGILSFHHKKTMALFLIFQLLRTREQRKIIEDSSNLLDEIIRKEFEGCKSNDSLLANDQEMVSLIQTSIMFDSKVREEYLEVFMEYIWIFGRNVSNTPFFTSDHPVSKIPHKRDPIMSYSGFASFGIEIAFPLSPQIILILCDRRAFKDLEKFEEKIIFLEKENIIYYNQFQVTQSFQNIFCSNNDFSLVQEIEKVSPEVFKQNRIRIISNH